MAFTQSDLNKVYAELQQMGKDAESDGIEVNDSLAFCLAENVMDENPKAVKYLKTVKRVADVQGHLADYI